MKYFGCLLIASSVVAAVGAAPVTNQIVIITNPPTITDYSTNQLARPGNHMNQVPGGTGTNGLHDVIGTNAPKDGMRRPTLTNQPIEKLPLR